MKKTGSHQGKKGTIYAEIEIEGESLKKIKLSGDFFFYPEEKLFELEERLKNCNLSQVREEIEKFFKKEKIQTPYLTSYDFWLAIEKACTSNP